MLLLTTLISKYSLYLFQLEIKKESKSLDFFFLSEKKEIKKKIFFFFKDFSSCYFIKINLFFKYNSRKKKETRQRENIYFLNLKKYFHFFPSTKYMLIFSQLKRSSTPSSMVPPTTSAGTNGMPFSVTDILQPLDIDASNSYKRSLEMAHALASSSSTSVYNSQRPSTSVTPASLCNPTFGPTSVHNNYYAPTATSTSAFSPNNQYYDYNSSLQTNANSSNVTGQYSPSSCWYGPAASMSSLGFSFSMYDYDLLF